jgi:hypothetical protein
MDALSATSLALLGSPPRRRDIATLALVGLLAVATALVCLTVAAESEAPDDRQMFGAVGAGLLAWLGWRVWLTRRRTHGTLRIGADGVLADDPAMLREPIHIPLASLRAAVVERDDRAGHRFRVHANSGPFVGSDRDGWLWERGRGSAVPALMRGERDEPNVALVLAPPVPAPRLRGRRGHGPLAGERLAGLLLRVDDPAAAEAALAQLGVLRPLTVPDALALAGGLGWVEEGPAPAGSRRALAIRSTQRTGWLLLAGGVVFPLCGFLAAVAGLTLWQGDRRRSGAALMLAGTVVCAARTATMVL